MRIINGLSPAHLHLRHVRFVGPTGVGKTTAIRAVSPVVTHRPGPVTLLGADPQPAVDVTDVGEWTGPGCEPVSIVAATGMAAPDVARQGAMPRAGGTVLWLYGNQRTGFTEAKLWLDRLCSGPSLSGLSAPRRLTVAITRLEMADAACPSVEDYEALVWCYDRNVPVLPADPRSTRAVERVLQVALRGSFHAKTA